MAVTAMISVLNQNLGNLSDGDRSFALSMLKQLEKKGDLSSKQWYWIDKLAQRSLEGPKEPPKEELGSFAGVIALFTKAAGHLKHPRIRLQTESGNQVCLSRAGQQSKYAGQINVSDGGPYGNNVWYGRIDAHGAFTQSIKVAEKAPTAMDEVTKLLRALAQDPVKVATQHGLLTGNCCFCNSGLKDEKSTSVGYGPVCAKHFGLPWGSECD